MSAASPNLPSCPIQAALAAALGRLAAGSRLAVGLSGGLDSVALLHGLVSLRQTSGLTLSAIHVHHGLMPRADDWADFCADLCRQWQVPLTVRRVQVARQGGQGLEAAARDVRYGAYRALDVDALALAHHRDDQAETLLLHLVRGAGVRGAAAMPEARPLETGAEDAANITLLRPLLHLGRADLEAYARQHQLTWVEDESNRDGRFGRNFMRHEILPRLSERFAGAATSLARAAAQFGEAAELLDDLAELDFARCAADGLLGIDALNQLSPIRAKNLLRHVFARHGCAMPDARRLDEALRQLSVIGENPNFELRLDQALVHAWRGRLHFDTHPALLPSTDLVWQGESELMWAGLPLRFTAAVGQGLSAERLAQVQSQISIRRRTGGERLRPHATGPSRSLKNLYQEAAVPPWLRPRLPLIWVDRQLAWVAGLGADAEFHCPPNAPGWQIDWQGLSDAPR